jgi:hypothetical protein
MRFHSTRLSSRPQRGLSRLVLIANLDFGASGRRESRPRDPVDVSSDQMGPQQLFVSPYDDPLSRRLRCYHIKRLGGGNAQSAPLAYGEVMNARVLAERAAISRYDLSLHCGLRGALLPEVGFEKRSIVVIRDEADLLAVCLLGHRQAKPARDLANFALIEIADREQCAGQLRLRQADRK